jgi:hypothetical protein
LKATEVDSCLSACSFYLWVFLLRLPFEEACWVLGFREIEGVADTEDGRREGIFDGGEGLGLEIGETEGAEDTEDGCGVVFSDGGAEGWVLGNGETEGVADTEDGRREGTEEDRREGDSEGHEEGNCVTGSRSGIMAPLTDPSCLTPTPTPTATRLAVAMERKKARRRPQVAPQQRRTRIRSTFRLRQNGTGFSGSTISPTNKSLSETKVADTRNPDFSERGASIRRDESDGSGIGVILL